MSQVHIIYLGHTQVYVTFTSWLSTHHFWPSNWTIWTKSFLYMVWYYFWNYIFRYLNYLIYMLYWSFWKNRLFFFNGTFEIVLGWVTIWGGCKTGLSVICMTGLLPGNNFDYSGFSYGKGIGNLSIFFFMPALPWPNLGLTWYWSFDSVGACNCGVTNGFIYLFFWSYVCIYSFVYTTHF